MTNNIRSSQRNVRRPARYGDSILSQNKRNRNKNMEKGKNQVNKKGDNGSMNEERKDSEMNQNKGKESMFDGDLNGESFPSLQSQVNKSKPNDVSINCDNNVENQLNDVSTSDVSKEDCGNNVACSTSGSVCENHEAVRVENECRKNNTRMGRLGFARVLIELNAEKMFKDVIEIGYRRKGVSTSLTKFVKVEYTWMPTRCSHCCVFGHDNVNCRMIPKDADNVELSNDKNEVNDGFQKVTYRKDKDETQFNKNKRNMQSGINGYTRGDNYSNRMTGQRQNNNRQEYKTKKNVDVANKPSVENNNGVENTGGNGSTDKENVNNSKHVKAAKEAGQNKTPNGSSNSSERRKNNVGVIGQNSFSPLNTLVNEEEIKLSNKEKEQVDSVLENNDDPTVNEWENWNDDMKQYYRDKKECLGANNKTENEEDVVQDLSSTEESLVRNEVEGICSPTLN
ncbi:zinc knuckle CX2CX4HX4C [Artemisia annua]|uniref:Zinc knuckle CX2CX4HX4C n=1 Tax=Artemisia annua TaxID=35608 RepID=A0A2U1P2L9_ARTAN|nr:zinc knuckle CX2CX4HX4C [Artemisia annua]